MYQHQNRNIQFQDWQRIDYQAAWDKQDHLFRSIIDTKIANRKRAANQQQTTPNYLIFCEHPPVYTLGKSGSLDNLLLNKQELAKQGIQFYKINRGGDITYHGPGQIVGYPILDLDNFFTDIHRYLRLLEETIIAALADYGLRAGRIKGATGVWLDYNNPFKARKICAMGIRCSRWVCMHGWAFNINTNLSHFEGIIPCGITDKAVTSLNRELGVSKVDVEEVKQKLQYYFMQQFEAVLI